MEEWKEEQLWRQQECHISAEALNETRLIKPQAQDCVSSPPTAAIPVALKASNTFEDTEKQM